MELGELEHWAEVKTFNGYRKEIPVSSLSGIKARGLYVTDTGRAYIVLSIQGNDYYCLKLGSLITKKYTKKVDVNDKFIEKDFVQFIDADIKLCNSSVESTILYAFASNFDLDFICKFKSKPNFILKMDFRVTGPVRAILDFWIDSFSRNIYGCVHRSISYKEYLPFIRGSVYAYKGKNYLYLGLQYCETKEYGGLDKHLFVEDAENVKNVNTYIKKKIDLGESCFLFDPELSDMEFTSKFYCNIELNNFSLLMFN